MKTCNGAEGSKAPGWAAGYRQMSEQTNKKGTATVLRTNRIQLWPANIAAVKHEWNSADKNLYASGVKSRCRRRDGGAGTLFDFSRVKCNKPVRYNYQ